MYGNRRQAVLKKDIGGKWFGQFVAPLVLHTFVDGYGIIAIQSARSIYFYFAAQNGVTQVFLVADGY